MALTANSILVTPRAFPLRHKFLTLLALAGTQTQVHPKELMSVLQILTMFTRRGHLKTL
jgi:hypothetical protein